MGFWVLIDSQTSHEVVKDILPDYVERIARARVVEILEVDSLEKVNVLIFKKLNWKVRKRITFSLIRNCLRVSSFIDAIGRNPVTKPSVRCSINAGTFALFRVEMFESSNLDILGKCQIVINLTTTSVHESELFLQIDSGIKSIEVCGKFNRVYSGFFTLKNRKVEHSSLYEVIVTEKDQRTLLHSGQFIRKGGLQRTIDSLHAILLRVLKELPHKEPSQFEAPPLLENEIFEIIPLNSAMKALTEVIRGDFCNKIRLGLIKLLFDKQWKSYICLPNGLKVCLNDHSPPRKSLADPMILKTGDTDYFVFCEYQDSIKEKGSIVAFKISMQDSQVCVVYCGSALKSEFHLSYPYVQKFQGKIYMLPEQFDSSDYWLYEELNFPHDWVRSVELSFLKGTVDPMIFEIKGSYICIASKLDPRLGFSRELIVYRSAYLRGPWEKMLVNSSTDFHESGTRNGGYAIFNGELIRVAQRASSNRYGQDGVVFKKLQLQHTNEYVEEEVGLPAVLIGTEIEKISHHVCIIENVYTYDVMEETIKVLSILRFILFKLKRR